MIFWKKWNWKQTKGVWLVKEMKLQKIFYLIHKVTMHMGIFYLNVDLIEIT